MHLEDEKTFLRNNGCQFVTVIQCRECQCYETTQIDSQYLVLRIVAYGGFLTLRSRDQYRRAGNRKFMYYYYYYYKIKFT